VLPALIRYVECKCLLGGVTTSQGIALFSNQGIRRYYRGLVRNVEATADADLPEALARIADVDEADAAAFAARLAKATCLLLHLSEGTDAAARAHSSRSSSATAGRFAARSPASIASRSSARTSTCSALTAQPWSGRRSRTCSSMVRPPT